MKRNIFVRIAAWCDYYFACSVMWLIEKMLVAVLGKDFLKDFMKEN